MKFSLTSMEHAIMMFFWKNRRWASGAELWEYLNRSGKNCKRQTVNTYLTRMAEKGILTKNGTKYMYTYTEEQFEAERAREVLDNVYQGTLVKHVKNKDGSCIVKYYDGKRCTQCGDVVYGRLIDVQNYEICPH